ncbi:MAG: molecular chaperone DnaJ [Bacillota bacterium]|nr:molecular chaperone DnaJ [Bacillota bacterium]
MANKDYYSILGIEKSASQDEIRSAFRKLAIKYHPDKNKGDKAAEEKFKEVNEAYQVLSDPQKRSNYDQFGTSEFDGGGSQGAQGFGGFGGFGGFDSDFGGFGDIFDSIFGGAGRGTRSRRSQAEPGADLEYNLNLTFEEAVFGCEKEVSINRNEKCETCNGTGAKKGTSPKTCDKCGGAGQIRVQRQTPLGTMSTVAACDKCHGTGKIIDEPCSTCHGTGKERKHRKIKINVPAGVDTGNVIPLRGQGEHGTNGGPSGDLYINIRVSPHPKFKRNGFDISFDTHISFGMAVMGAEISVETVDGPVKYTIPEGTQSGTVFRLRGKGVPRVNSSGRGDQYVKVIVDIPKKINEKQMEALKNFMKISCEDVSDYKESFKDKFKNSFK